MRSVFLIIASLCLTGMATVARASSGYNDCDFSDLHRFSAHELTFSVGKISKATPYKPAVLFEAGGPCVGLEPTLCSGPATSAIERNQPVMIAFERGAVVCVIFQKNDSLVSGWVDKNRINVKTTKPLALSNWQGTWRSDQGRTKTDLNVMSVSDFTDKYRAQKSSPDPESVYALLTYDPSKREGLGPQSVGLTGYSTYSFDTLGGSDTHMGMFIATTTFNGPVLLYDEAVEDRHGARNTDCLVVMLNFGDTLAVTDQGRCGGESVRFNGTFKRTKTQYR